MKAKFISPLFFFSFFLLISGHFLHSTPRFLNPKEAEKNGLRYPKLKPGSFRNDGQAGHGAVSKASVFGTAMEARIPTSLPSGSVLINLVIVPVQFSDSNLTINVTDISNLFFGPAYSTVSNYYEVQSHGKFRFSGQVVPPITLPGTRASFAADTETYARFATNAAIQITNSFSGMSASTLSDTFDKNSDGFVDIIVYYHAGEGAETSSSSSDIHSHQYSYYYQEDYIGNNALHYLRGQLRFGRYLIVPEIQNPKFPFAQTNQRSTIGTLCHELAHCLGLVDLYNTMDGFDSGVGNAELMSVGSYNYLPTWRESHTNVYIYPVYGKYPAPISSYNKVLLGWISPVDLGPGTGNKTFLTIGEYGAASAPNKSYRVKGPSEEEYWFVENRNHGSTNATNFDLGLGGQGLLIWRVNEKVIGDSNSHYFSKNGINNDPTLRGLRLEPFKPTLYESTFYAVSNAFWSASASGFSPISTPAAAYENNGIFPGVSVYNISQVSTLMSFDFRTASFDQSAKVTGDHFPSPFRPVEGTLSISISLPVFSGRSVNSIVIVGEGGVLVRSLPPSQIVKRQSQNKEQYVVSWDGKDDGGRSVNPGLYYYRILTSREVVTAGRVYVRH